MSRRYRAVHEARPTTLVGFDDNLTHAGRTAMISASWIERA
ncbi:hypothetical protein PAMC26577_22055 [Caballeronia sordidicola]|uniref:Uncharacterized protein n=1 Tax=Caballeronia sordidicola TaxID=196367 RepID=A0A242MMT2_CABSO|nr:hypothetical protein PAMC26577_22055 [Caballeronia sordidicola]